MSSIERACQVARTLLKIVFLITLGLLLGLAIGIGAGVRLHSRQAQPANCVTGYTPQQIGKHWVLVPVQICKEPAAPRMKNLPRTV